MHTPKMSYSIVVIACPEKVKDCILCEFYFLISIGPGILAVFAFENVHFCFVFSLPGTCALCLLCVKGHTLPEVTQSPDGIPRKGCVK